MHPLATHHIPDIAVDACETCPTDAYHRAVFSPQNANFSINIRWLNNMKKSARGLFQAKTISTSKKHKFLRNLLVKCVEYVGK